jgi:hypothetical protein
MVTSSIKARLSVQTGVEVDTSGWIMGAVAVGCTGVEVGEANRASVGVEVLFPLQAARHNSKHPTSMILKQMDTDLGEKRRVSICFL